MRATPVSSVDLTERLAVALVENSPHVGAGEAALRAALQQATGNPGRLVRAQLVHLGARTHGLGDDEAVMLACAVEYYHVASLLLDDLPCMDDAETRRGAPCVHRVHGDATAILAALALINRAYALIGFALASQPADVRLRAQAGLDACLGTAGILGGQAQDLRFAASDRSVRAVSRIAIAKTGSLLWLAIVFPALPGRPSAPDVSALQALCHYWSLAYQAADDLADVLSSEGETGKTGQRDLALARPNLALALGVPGCRRRLVRLEAQATRALAKLEAGSGRWSYLRHFHQRMFACAQTAVAA